MTMSSLTRTPSLDDRSTQGSNLGKSARSLSAASSLLTTQEPPLRVPRLLAAHGIQLHRDQDALNGSFAVLGRLDSEPPLARSDNPFFSAADGGGGSPSAWDVPGCS